jgi:hypothetical protein
MFELSPRITSQGTGVALARRFGTQEASLVARIAAIDVRIGEIDKRLAAEFPDYAALVSAAPLSLASVQAQLGSNEALILDGERHCSILTFSWRLSRPRVWDRKTLTPRCVWSER